MSSTAKQIKVTGTNRAGHLVFAAVAVPVEIRTDNRTSKYLAFRSRALVRFRKKHPGATVDYVSIVEYRVEGDPYRNEAENWPTKILVNGFLPRREPVWVSAAAPHQPSDADLIAACASALAEFREKFPSATDITLKARVNSP